MGGSAVSGQPEVAAARRRPVPHPLAFLVEGWRHRTLIRRLTHRRIQSQYRGSALGMAWSVVQPLLSLGIYTFVFSMIFRARWSTEARGEVALLVFAGLIVFSLFARPVAAAPELVLSHRTYVKQVVFPVEVLAWVSVLAALFEFLVAGGVLLAIQCITVGPPAPGALAMAPLLLVPLLLLTLGAVWLLASLGVFLRDISQVVGLLTTALLFLSPIFYPASFIPDPYAAWSAWNPIAVLVEAFRAALFGGAPPDPRALAWVAGLSWLTAWLGHAWFVRTRPGFADVL